MRLAATTLMTASLVSSGRCWITGQSSTAVRSMSLLSAAKGFWGKEKVEESDPGAVLGTNLRVLPYPHPKLRAANEAVTEYDEELKRFADEMFLVMYATDGIGLAAPQVGVNKRLLIFNEEGDPARRDCEMVLCNPSIVGRAEFKKIGYEACLSFPRMAGRVARHSWVEVEYQTLEGTTHQKRFEDMAAIIFQHEYDHLDRILFIDRMLPNDRDKLQRRLSNMIKKFGEGGVA